MVMQLGFGREPRASFAANPDKSLGRLYKEAESPSRTVYQRDRDRIIHSTAFRRLKHKTQVFVYHEDDHFRTRLTHTIEVAQIARALARAFRLDEDLAEALALAHDLGHTPFGHAGEDALNDCMAEFGGFDHNGQCLRIVTMLERHYAKFDGLNLTWEMLEGLAKHNGPLIKGEGGDDKISAQTNTASHAILTALQGYQDHHDLEGNLHLYAGLEAQVAAIADDIAYDSHDIDDGLRAGLLTLQDLEAVPVLGAILSDVHKEYPGLEDSRLIHELVRRLITQMVEDVIHETQRRIIAYNIETMNDIRHAGSSIATFSKSFQEGEKAIKAFLFTKMYRHSDVMRIRGHAEQIVRDLFNVFYADFHLLPQEWQFDLDKSHSKAVARRISDYIAGMTDRFAIREHRRLFDATPQLR